MRAAAVLPSLRRAPAKKAFAPDKIFAHQDRIREWLDNGASRPVTYELDLCNACNHACPHCFGFHPERDRSMMPLGQVKRVIRQIRDMGGRGLTFTGGGDPLVHPAACEAVEFAADSGLDIGFITNGTGLTPRIMEVLLRRCVWVRISLDAASPEMFRKTHGMGEAVFESVLGKLRTLTRLKRILRSKTTVGTGFLTSPETLPDIYAFARLSRDLGVDYAQYRPLLRRHGGDEIDYSGRALLGEMLRAEGELSNASFRVLCSEHKYRCIADGEVGRRYGKCYGQHFAAVVAADSKMYVCCHMRGVRKYAIGDLGKDSLQEVWSSRKRERVARSVDLRDCPPLCRCDSFNGILWDLKTGGRRIDDVPDGGEWEHRNFI